MDCQEPHRACDVDDSIVKIRGGEHSWYYEDANVLVEAEEEKSMRVG